MIEEKLCKDCGKYIPLTDFYSYKEKITGEKKYFPRCKQCFKKYQDGVKSGEIITKPRIKKKFSTKLDEITVLARQCGLTYGYYVALTKC